MSSTMESKSDKHTRVSTLNVRPSVAGIIADRDGNLDEKKAVAALSQTREQNKHMWIACFVLIGTVFVLIAANIGTSVAVARLTRQLNVDPVTGMATIPGSDDIVMKTSTAVYKGEDISFHTVPIDYLSAVKTVEFHDGNISFDVKGFARMTNETIILVEGGSLMFDMNGLMNITGDELPRLFSSIEEDIHSIDLDGRKLCGKREHGRWITCSEVQAARAHVPPPQESMCRDCGDASKEIRVMFGVTNALNGVVCCYNGQWGGDFCQCPGTLADAIERHGGDQSIGTERPCTSCSPLGLGPMMDNYCCGIFTETLFYTPDRCGRSCDAFSTLPSNIQSHPSFSYISF